MKQVSGWLTEDGSFYERKEVAEQHEAQHFLHGAYKQFVGENANFDRFTSVIINLAPEIRRFLNANETSTDQEDRDETEQAHIEREILSQRKRPSTYKHSSDDGLGGAFESLEQFPSGRYLHVPDMGYRPPTEEIQDSRKVDGTRSR